MNIPQNKNHNLKNINFCSVHELFCQQVSQHGTASTPKYQSLKHIQVVLHESCKSSSDHRTKRANEYSLLKSEKEKARNKKKESGWIF